MKSRSKHFSWYVASRKDEGKLISFIKGQLGPDFSSRSIKKALELNLCKVNGHIERFASKEVHKGDHIQLAKNWEELSIVSQQKYANLLFEDDAFYIIDKPAGISCGPNLLKKCKTRKKLILLHRLDRDTTGVLIYVKSKDIQEKMILQFKSKSVEKTYLAIVDKKMNRKSGTIENYLGPVKRLQGQVIYGQKETGGQYACTHFKCLKTRKDCSLVQCMPITGRTHQIRVHLAQIGHPILGDSQYCRSFVCKKIVSRHMLHAWKVQFTHPVTQQKLLIEAPLAEEFTDWL